MQAQAASEAESLVPVDLADENHLGEDMGCDVDAQMTCHSWAHSVGLGSRPNVMEVLGIHSCAYRYPSVNERIHKSPVGYYGYKECCVGRGGIARMALTQQRVMLSVACIRQQMVIHAGQLMAMH